MRKLSLLGVALCLSGFILLLFSAPLPVAENVMKLNFSDFFPPSNPFAKIIHLVL